MFSTGPVNIACFFLYSAESGLSSGLEPGGPGLVGPCKALRAGLLAVMAPFDLVGGEREELMPLMEVDVLILSRGETLGLDWRDSRGERAGYRMTCSRKGTE